MSPVKYHTSCLATLQGQQGFFVLGGLDFLDQQNIHQSNRTPLLDKASSISQSFSSSYKRAAPTPFHST
ncbi:hypothetical protein Pfo_010974 [Paulownia fortunei]|nr:hypothetical protein Pfo_010974 [Paulownia fortunei]